MEPKTGLLTFRAEGNNVSGSIYYSRKIHWPGKSSDCTNYASGVTIGRGYDMKHRSAGQIISDLTCVGVSLEDAKKIAEGATKSSCSADEFVKNNKHLTVEITEAQQVRLFELIYKDYVSASEKFYNNYKEADSVPWEKLHPILKDVLIDMRYQGALDRLMIPVFGKNNKDDVIRLIKITPVLKIAERARGRIEYIKRYMK